MTENTADNAPKELATVMIASPGERYIDQDLFSGGLIETLKFNTKHPGRIAITVPGGAEIHMTPLEWYARALHDNPIAEISALGRMSTFHQIAASLYMLAMANSTISTEATYFFENSDGKVPGVQLSCDGPGGPIFERGEPVPSLLRALATAYERRAEVDRLSEERKKKAAERDAALKQLKDQRQVALDQYDMLRKSREKLADEILVLDREIANF